MKNILKHGSCLPEASLLKNIPHEYADSYSVAFNAKDATIEQVGKSFLTSDPAWVDWLFALRNRIVSLFGLKTSGARTKEAVLQNFKCEIGERVGLFKIFDKNEHEIILGEDDKHLDFRVSVLKTAGPEPLAALSTWVHPHNLGGRLYLCGVMPFHKLIIRRMLANVAA